MAFPFKLPDWEKLSKLDEKLDQRYAEFTRAFNDLMSAIDRLEKEMKLANSNITTLTKNIEALNRTIRKTRSLPLEEETPPISQV